MEPINQAEANRATRTAVIMLFNKRNHYLFLDIKNPGDLSGWGYNFIRLLR
jgi:hypothetical protein